MKNQELTGCFDGERWVFQQDDPERRTIIGSLADGTTVKGRATAGALEYGMTYRFLGRWTTHPKYGKQFAFSSFVVSKPHGETATIKYLMRQGKGHGLGRARAKAIWRAYGEQACEVIRTDPERVAAEIAGVSLDAAQALAERFQANERLEAVTIEVNDLLASRGFPQQTADKAIKEWGERASEVIREDPYQLMRFRGVGFARADALYLELGLDPAALNRQGYCVLHSMASSGEGHTWFPLKHVRMALKQSIASAKLRLETAIQWAIEHELIATRDDGDWLAEAGKAWAEQRLAEHVHQAERESEATELRWPDLSGSGCSDHQIQEAAKATAGILGVLAGSPGTGKTFTLAKIVRAIQESEGAARIAVCAPTGKAAVRVTENLARQGVGLVATTIHRLLGVIEADGDGWTFEHNADNPLPIDYLFVDETSMCDTTLLASLLAARPAGCHVLLIGDPDQLSPVGHGAPLRDLIAAGLPCGHLKEIQRNAGRIVRACAEIRDDQRIEFSPKADVEAGENLVLVRALTPEAQLRELEARLGAAGRDGHDPTWDCQVVVPLNEKGPLARTTLNRELQKLLNPSGQRMDGCPFRGGDKIVCTKNGTLPLIEGDRNGSPADGEAYVANGELAKVIEIRPTMLVLRLDSPYRLVRVPRGKAKGGEESNDTGCNFDLAYALSVHKSQGSEWPIVIVMLDSCGGAVRLCDRHWLYTAISRAKELCVCIGAQKTANAMVAKSHMWLRKTFLRESIDEDRMESLRLAWINDMNEEVVA